MADSFVTVYELAESGYRAMPWLLGLGAFFIAAGFYIYSLKPASRGETLYRNGLVLFVLLAFAAFTAYHLRAYLFFHHMLTQLGSGQARVVSGHVTALYRKGYYLYIDVEGQRLSVSRYEWPYKMGVHPQDISLKKMFLIKVYLVDDVVARLQVHNIHF